MTMIYCGAATTPITHYGEHSHDAWELIIPDSDVVTEAGEKTYLLTPSDMLLIPPNTLHSGKSELPFRDIFIRVSNLAYQPEPFVIHDYDGALPSLFAAVSDFFTRKEYNYKNICNSLLEAIVGIIDKNLSEDYRHPAVYEVKRIINENISNTDFSVTDAIVRAGYNSDYIRRVFVSDVGVSPHAYLVNIRLSNAKKRLQNESYLRIETIAQECGFADQFYFSRAFKKKFGISPREYRYSSLMAEK